MKYLYNIVLRGNIIHSSKDSLQQAVSEYLSGIEGFRLIEANITTWADGEGDIRTFDGKYKFTLQGRGNLLADSEQDAQNFITNFANKFNKLVITYSGFTAYTIGSGIAKFTDDGKEYYESDDLTNTTDLEKAKADRTEAVSKIMVTVDDMIFDGDETAQNRMARTIVALDDSESMPWVLADNTVTTVTKEQLRQALRAAGLAQAALWVKPYTE